MNRIRIGRSSRRAFTLIEMVVVISATAALTSLSIMLLALLLRADASGNEAIVAQMTFARLAREFRNDAHRAESASPKAGAAGVTFRMTATESVTWSADGAAVVRERQVGPTLHSARFELPQGDAQFGLEEGRLAVLVCRRRRASSTESPDPSRNVPSLEMRVEAALGIEAQAAD